MHKKLFLFFLLLISLELWAAGNKERDNSPLIMVTIPPQKFLLEQLTGGEIRIESLLDSSDNPHTFQPRPSQIELLHQADLYITSGIGLEDSFMEDLREMLPHMEVVDSSKEVRFRTMEEAHGHEENHEDREEKEGDHHEGEDPHFWLSPQRVMETLPIIEEALLRTYPELKESLEMNYRNTEQMINDLDRELMDRLSPFSGKLLFVFHPAFGYFTDRYGLRQKAVETGGKEPTPRQMETIIEEARKEGVKLLLVQPQFSRNAAEAIAESIGGRVETFNTLEYDWVENLKRLASYIESTD